MTAEELAKLGIEARIAGDEETFLRIDRELQADAGLASTSVARRYHALAVAACGAALMLASTGCGSVQPQPPMDVYAGPPEVPAVVVPPRQQPPTPRPVQPRPMPPPPQPQCVYAGPPIRPSSLVPRPPTPPPPPPMPGYKGPQQMQRRMVPGPGAPGPTRENPK